LDTVFVPRPFFKLMEGIINGAHHHWYHQSETEEGADYRVADGGGLYILVRPNGSKLWRYDYRLDSSRRTHSIGE
jgi:hypothetical protein